MKEMCGVEYIITEREDDFHLICELDEDHIKNEDHFKRRHYSCEEVKHADGKSQVFHIHWTEPEEL